MGAVTRIIPGPAVKANSSTLELAHEGMATTFHLRLVSVTEKLGRQVAAAAWSELVRLEQLLSRYVDGSDVSRINRAALGEPIRINADTMQCVRHALNMRSVTGSAFNPMLGAWTGEAGHRPPNSRLRAMGDAPDLLLNETELTATRTNEDMFLDLGGIGKGFAVDKLVEILRDWEVPAACIDAGGSTIFAFGQPEPHTAWQAQLAAHLVPLENASIAGSGVSVKGDHILDGRTGIRYGRHTRVWAYAPTASEADALSTAFFAFSTAELEAFCTRHPQYGGGCLAPDGTVWTAGALRAN